MATGTQALDWSAWQGGIRLASELEVSFQRYVKPNTETISDMPASLGAITVAEIGRNTFLLPLHDAEAFWISVDRQQISPWAFCLSVVLADGTAHDLLSRPSGAAAGSVQWVPPMRTIAGLTSDDGSIRPLFRSSGPASQGALKLLVHSNGAAHRNGASNQVAVAECQTVDPAEFSARTGLPAPDPPDTDHAYRGYLLP